MNNQAHLQTWRLYQSAWGPVSDAERGDLLARSVADGIVYTDPVSEAHGRAALIERIGQSQARFPGARFENDEFLEHHDQGLFHWTMYDAKGAFFVKGSSFARFAQDGRLVQATGFFKTPGT